MWPDASDDVLLAELGVIVSAGWELPSRPARAHSIRHLLLLVALGDSLSYPQAAQRLLLLIDDALRDADDEFLIEDQRTGCRILLGTHPTYRAVPSPTTRRADAADFLIESWHEAPPGDPAGTFQRRHQRGALRQILECLRRAYERSGVVDDPYDVARVHRWYRVDENRQVSEYGETTEYRVLQDGLTSVELLETEPDPEGLESAQFQVVAVGEDPAPVLERIETDPTRPGYRPILLRLPRPYDAGETLAIAWRERATYGAEASQWQRSWVSVVVLNDNFDLAITVDFTGCSPLPDLCWRFSVEAGTDLNEIGPDSLSHLLDVSATSVASIDWPATETTSRRLYGCIWAWFDGDEESIDRWENYKAGITLNQRSGS